jgi:hypothetical protein
MTFESVVLLTRFANREPLRAKFSAEYKEFPLYKNVACPPRLDVEDSSCKTNADLRFEDKKCK